MQKLLLLFLFGVLIKCVPHTYPGVEYVTTIAITDFILVLICTIVFYFSGNFSGKDDPYKTQKEILGLVFISGLFFFFYKGINPFSLDVQETVREVLPESEKYIKIRRNLKGKHPLAIKITSPYLPPYVEIHWDYPNVGIYYSYPPSDDDDKRAFYVKISDEVIERLKKSKE